MNFIRNIIFTKILNNMSTLKCSLLDNFIIIIIIYLMIYILYSTTKHNHLYIFVKLKVLRFIFSKYKITLQ
jgi:hypothetical protein